MSEVMVKLSDKGAAKYFIGYHIGGHVASRDGQLDGRLTDALYWGDSDGGPAYVVGEIETSTGERLRVPLIDLVPDAVIASAT
jgi:hypothetical protein